MCSRSYSNGYAGAATPGPPGDDLLSSLRQMVAPIDAGGSGGFLAYLAPTAGTAPDAYKWSQGLPPSLKRAAPEINANIRAAGVGTLRE